MITEYLEKCTSAKKKQASNIASVTIICLQDTKESTKQLIGELNGLGISSERGYDGTITPCRVGSTNVKIGGVALIWQTHDSEALKIKMSRISIPEAEYNFCREFVRCQILDEDE